MKIRIISGVIGAILFAFAIALNKVAPWLINVMFAAGSLTCVIEILSAKRYIKDYKLSIPSIIFASLFPILISTQFWPILLLAYIFTNFAILLKFNKKLDFSKIAFTLTTVLIIVAGLTSVVILCDSNRSTTGLFITMTAIIAWVADAGAYFVGSFFGKTKLCPNVSPKKTVEGAIGGVVIAVIGVLINSLVFNLFLFNNGEMIQYLNLIVIAFFGAFISILGDLSFSLIKRSCHIKDYGNAIPGHGGILDRCDSLIFVSPFVLVMHQILPIVIS